MHRRRFIPATALVGLAVVVVAVSSARADTATTTTSTTSTTAPAATPTTTTPALNSGDAYYSAQPEVAQSKSPAGMRAFLSTNQPEYSEQSFVWAGPLIADDGTTSTAAFELQRDNQDFGGLMAQTMSAAMLVNDGTGYRVGGIGGLPDITFPVAFTQIPWSIRATQGELLQQPQFVDARVVEGEIGRKGAIYELTSHVNDISTGAPAGSTTDVYVRVRDTTGLMQWGFGPSGFAPMWIFDDQRQAITTKYQGSVGAYLTATGDPMRSQGQYYYTLPLLQVERFVVQVDGRIVRRGHRGWLWFDNVARSFSAQANEVIGSGIGWFEFSVQLPGSHQAMKIGFTDAPKSTGKFPYAYLSSPSATRARNGALTATAWGIDSIEVKPVPGFEWTNPRTGDTYPTKYEVNLAKSKTAPAVHLTFTQAVKDAEAVVQGRSVYEGAYDVKGTIGSRTVKGYAFLEDQLAGKGD